MGIRTGPLGYSFTGLRLVQFIILVTICGITANLGVTVNRLDAPRIPHELLVAIIVSGVGMVYVLTTLLLHVLGVYIKYIISYALDIVLLGALSAVAALTGRPLTNLSCKAVKRFSGNIVSLGDVLDNYGVEASTSDGGVSSSVTTSNSGADFKLREKDVLKEVPRGYDGLKSVWGMRALGSTVGEVERNLGEYRQWVGRVGRWCNLMKVVWALAILGAILMLASATVAFLLWRKSRAIPWEEDGEKYGGEEQMLNRNDPLRLSLRREQRRQEKVQDQGAFEPGLGASMNEPHRGEPVLNETPERTGYGEVQSYGNSDAGALRV